jgi:hypothetical protein
MDVGTQKEKAVESRVCILSPTLVARPTINPARAQARALVAMVEIAAINIPIHHIQLEARRMALRHGQWNLVVVVARWRTIRDSQLAVVEQVAVECT